MERGRMQGLPKFFEYPYYLRNGQSYELQICTHILSIDQNNNFWSYAVAGCVVRTLKTFTCTHILGASRGLLCDSYAVLF